jgi:hypothetical protein
LVVREPGEHIALIRSWKTMTLIAKKTPLTDEETARVRAFADERSFDVSYLPGIAAAEANRYNILEGEPFHAAAMALLGPDRQDFIERYKFAIAAATDDRPYFFDFFKWRSLPELFALRTQGAASMLDMGYLMLFSTLAQAAVLSIVLILAPLLLRRRAFGGTAPKARVLAYFLALGLGFLFLEIAFIQRFSLFLGHPLYSAAVMLTGFLVFAGVGSALSGRTMQAFGSRLSGSPLSPIVVGIATLAVIYILVLPPIFDALIHLPDPAKIAISLALVAPLACLMGMPFPIGIASSRRATRKLCLGRGRSTLCIGDLSRARHVARHAFRLHHGRAHRRSDLSGRPRGARSGAHRFTAPTSADFDVIQPCASAQLSAKRSAQWSAVLSGARALGASSRAAAIVLTHDVPPFRLVSKPSSRTRETGQTWFQNTFRVSEAQRR